ncbi:MAG: cytochrome c [Dehalococcoidales bacterium]|nr:cytochrome c [Dehalococcoidales bacterium]
MSKVCSWRWSVALVAVLAFLGLNGVVQAAGADAGKAVYERNACSACHGTNGEGGAGPALKGAAFAEQYSNVDKLVAFIRKGGGGMPGFTEERIDQAQIDDLVYYIQSLSKSSGKKGEGESAKAARVGSLTIEQLYGLGVMGVGVLLLLVFAAVLNGPLKVRRT